MNVDWIIHFIPCTPRPSFHTHGLDRHNSLELELNLSLMPKQAMQFINLIAMNMVKTGKRYQSGDREDDVFNLPFYLFETTPIQPSHPTQISSAPARLPTCGPCWCRNGGCCRDGADQ